MDLGFFKRSRTDFWGWIVGPILLATVIHVAARAHHSHVDESLQWKQEFVGTVPGLEGKLGRANEVIASLNAHAVTGSSSRELLGESIDDLAQRCDFLIESLSIDRGVNKKQDHVAHLDVDVKGEGQLLSITRFLDELQADDDLMEIESARIRVKNFAAGPLYYGEFVLRYHEIAPE